MLSLGCWRLCFLHRAVVAKHSLVPSPDVRATDDQVILNHFLRVPSPRDNNNNNNNNTNNNNPSINHQHHHDIIASAPLLLQSSSCCCCYCFIVDARLLLRRLQFSRTSNGF